MSRGVGGVPSWDTQLSGRVVPKRWECVSIIGRNTVTMKISSTFALISTPAETVSRAFATKLNDSERITHLNLDESWAVRKHKTKSGAYFLLYHHHPKCQTVIRRSGFKKPDHDGATLGLVGSPPGISDKLVGHARCLVCDTVAPGRALGFLEMCKWAR